MKILFAIQGTGNGHLCRARDIYPELIKYGDVDVLISGTQADVDVPFPVEYRRYGLSFISGKSGGIDFWDTARKLRLLRLINDIRQFPIDQYDLVINDFEPVSAWACKMKKKRCISLSHQCAVLHIKAPRPVTRDLIGEWVLRNYAPVTHCYGFHFQAFAQNIFTPVIRKEVRRVTAIDKGHYTVYLPAYDDSTLVKHLSQFPHVKWEVFSKHNKKPFIADNVTVRKIDNGSFIESMGTCTGILCGAGFEGPAEAMHLGKKILVIPMQAQYEQQCNAAGLALMGATVIEKLDEKYYSLISGWIDNGKPVDVNYPDFTEDIVCRIFREHALDRLLEVKGADTW
jgi:uncharacterized protein (TIGR00661 family)